ncbi:hypothetical protein Tco_0327449 [Tanacetum coccineum]
MHQPWRTQAAIINKCLSDTPKAAIDVSKESDSEPARKITAGRRVIKKKVTISADDNIIPDPDVALELGKSIRLTEAAEEAAARQNLSPDPSQKLKGVLTLTPKEKLATDTMKALKESKKTNRRQPGTEGSTEGTGSIPEVPDESTIVPATSSEGIEDDDEDDDDDDDKSINLEKTDDEETDDELVHSDAEKTEEVKDDTKKVELPPTSSSLSVSLGFDPLHVVIQRVYVLEKDVQELKEADNTTTLSASLKSEIPLAVYAFLGSSLGDELHKVLQRHTEELIQKYPQQIDYKEMIKEFVQANLINEVKNQLPTLLPKAVSDFATLVIKSNVNKALEKTPLPLAQSSSQAQSSLKVVESLSE